jgi:GT2 family glycosyltransferase
VLLVNDVGPEADAIETAVLERIKGRPGFTYHRNPNNLGFVGTCNRAALELDETDNDILLLNSDTVVTPGFVDEMSAVLHLRPDHGIASARSNSATIATLPYRRAETNSGRTFERTEEVFSAISEFLPRYSIAPVAMGFCFLIKRGLIKKYGLFDEAFAPGYGEENDYCLRLNKAGHLSVIANHALVFHEGSKSFAQIGRNAIRDAHELILDKRYPHYRRSVRFFNYFGVSGVEWFADLIVPRSATPKVAIDLRGLGDVYQDDSERRRVLDEVRASVILPLVEGFAVEVVADPVDLASLGLDPSVVSVRSDTKDPVEIYDIGLVLADSLAPARLIEANRRYLRWGIIHSYPATLPPWSSRVSHSVPLFAEADLRRFSTWEVVLDRGEVRDLALMGIDPLDLSARRVVAGPTSQSPRELVEAFVEGLRPGSGLSRLIDQLEQRWRHFLPLEHYLAEADRELQRARAEQPATQVSTRRSRRILSKVLRR